MDITEDTQPASKAPVAGHSVFREKSLDRARSNTELHAYLQGSGGITWMAFVAAAIVVAAAFVWASLVSPDSLLSLLLG